MAKTFTTVICEWCGSSVEKPTGEVTRSLKMGRHFYCNNVCSGFAAGAKNPARKQLVTKVCPHCGEPFQTMTGAKSSTFCSRSCASAGSVSEERRAAQRAVGLKSTNIGTTEAIAASLRTREAWKYQRLKDYLDGMGESYVFEYIVGNRIFDLALPDRKLLVEFDGEDHTGNVQDAIDEEKRQLATSDGWTLIRVEVRANSVIPPNKIEKIFEL